MSSMNLKVIQPENENHMPEILDAFNAEFKDRGIITDVDAMEASLAVVSAAVAEVTGATDLRFVNDTTVIFYFGMTP